MHGSLKRWRTGRAISVRKSAAVSFRVEIRGKIQKNNREERDRVEIKRDRAYEDW